MIAFGNLAEITGSEMKLEVPDTGALLAELMRRYPALVGRKILIAVNQQVTKANIELKNGDTVALMPPYSGG